MTEPVSVALPVVLTAHLPPGGDQGPALAALHTGLGRGLLLDLPLDGAGVVLHRLGGDGTPDAATATAGSGGDARPWEHAHSAPEVEALHRAAAQCGPVYLPVLDADEARVLAAALLVYERLAPCDRAGVDCLDDLDACERHGLAERLRRRFTGEITGVDPDDSP